ncbi:MAG: hypothetical protein V3S51_03335, partial [Dehalococcoidia bacterium]
SVRTHYVDMWRESLMYHGTSLEELTPASDLYWAVRIGFADKILEAVGETQPQRPNAMDVVDSIKDIVSTIAIRQLKEQRTIDDVLQRLPPTEQEIGHQLEQRIGPIWGRLPSKVVNCLVKAEKYYRSGVNEDDAIVWFHKAIEACLSFYFVEPLGVCLSKLVSVGCQQRRLV